jgi:hypothetical protein
MVTTADGVVQYVDLEALYFQYGIELEKSTKF